MLRIPGILAVAMISRATLLRGPSAAAGDGTSPRLPRVRPWDGRR
ncbi:hypothetical protein [Candidatus Amarobacter glycogenicus]